MTVLLQCRAHIHIDLLDHGRRPYGIALRDGYQPQFIHDTWKLSSSQRAPQMVQLLECERIQLHRKPKVQQIRVCTVGEPGAVADGGFVRKGILALQELDHIRDPLQAIYILRAGIVAGKEHIQVEIHRRIQVYRIGRWIVPAGRLVFQRALLFQIDHGDHDVIGEIVSATRFQQTDVVYHNLSPLAMVHEIVRQLRLEQCNSLVNHARKIER
jgi:hypothetical protein